MDPKTNEFCEIVGHFKLVYGEEDDIIDTMNLHEPARHYWYCGERLFRQEAGDRPVKYKSVLSIAGYITAFARATMLYAIYDIYELGGFVYYCDTDSIVTDTMLPEHMVDNVELGKFKLERPDEALDGVLDGRDWYWGDEFEIAAPKHYREGYEFVIKGVFEPTSMNGPHDKTRFNKMMTNMTAKGSSRNALLEGGAKIHEGEIVTEGRNASRVEPASGYGKTMPRISQVQYDNDGRYKNVIK